MFIFQKLTDSNIKTKIFNKGETKMSVYFNTKNNRVQLSLLESTAVQYYFDHVNKSKGMLQSTYHGFFHLMNAALVEYLEAYPKGSSYAGTRDDFKAAYESYHDAIVNPQEQDRAPLTIIEMFDGTVFNYDNIGKCIGESK